MNFVISFATGYKKHLLIKKKLKKYRSIWLSKSEIDYTSDNCKIEISSNNKMNEFESENKRFQKDFGIKMSF